MSYTARSVAAACAPWPLVIGARTYWARPISAALVISLLPRLSVSDAAAIAVAMRAAFPSPRHWWHRDPVRAIGQLSPSVQLQIVRELFATPADRVDDLDPIARAIAAHRAIARPVEKGRGVTLAVAALACEVRMGADWYFNPDRWPTSDGYVPHAVVWTTYRGLFAIDARARMEMANAVALGMADPKSARRAWDALESAAFPIDRGVH